MVSRESKALLGPKEQKDLLETWDPREHQVLQGLWEKLDTRDHLAQGDSVGFQVNQA